MPIGIMLMLGLFWHLDVIDNYDHIDDNFDAGADVDGETGFVYMCVCDWKQDSKSC